MCGGVFLSEWDSNSKIREVASSLSIFTLTRLGLVAKIVLASASEKEYDLS